MGSDSKLWNFVAVVLIAMTFFLCAEFVDWCCLRKWYSPLDWAANGMKAVLAATSLWAMTWVSITVTDKEKKP